MCDVTDNKTPLRPIRVEEDLWAEFGRLVGIRNRSQVIRDFIRWFVRERGAQLPVRPGAAAAERPDDGPELRARLMRVRNELVHSGKKLTLSSDEEEALSPMEFLLLLHMADELSDPELAKILSLKPSLVRPAIRRVDAKLRAVGEVKLLIPKTEEES